MRMNEGFIHVAVRRALKHHGWRLIAGQFPGGSDDECYALNVMDPVVACDNSPDPRRHSDNKLVPDLFAMKGNVVLILEMKPSYSAEDESKLLSISGDRRTDLLTAMRKFGRERGVPEFCDPELLTLVLGLGFRAGSRFPRNPTFAYLLVSDLDNVEVLAPIQCASTCVSEAMEGGF